MPSRRVHRLNEQFKRELMYIVQRELKDPRVTGVTITAAEVSPDLYHARIFLTSPAPESERATIMAGLQAATPFLRGELGRRLRIRRVPELDFTWDRSIDHARRIEELLAQVRPPDPPVADD